MAVAVHQQAILSEIGCSFQWEWFTYLQCKHAKAHREHSIWQISLVQMVVVCATTNGYWIPLNNNNDGRCTMEKDYRSSFHFQWINRYFCIHSIYNTNNGFIVYIVDCRNRISCCHFPFDLNDIAHDTIVMRFMIYGLAHSDCGGKYEQLNHVLSAICHAANISFFCPRIRYFEKPHTQSRERRVSRLNKQQKKKILICDRDYFWTWKKCNLTFSRSFPWTPVKYPR